MSERPDVIFLALEAQPKPSFISLLEAYDAEAPLLMTAKDIWSSTEGTRGRAQEIGAITMMSHLSRFDPHSTGAISQEHLTGASHLKPHL
jgi:hypothetical protein